MSNPFTVSRKPSQLKTSRLADASHHYDDPLPLKDLVFLQSINEQECRIKSSQINSRISNTVPMFVVLLHRFPRQQNRTADRACRLACSNWW